MLDALMALIDEDAAREPARETWEIFIGDFVDRGPDSAGVIDRLVADPQEGRHRVCLMGNHEEAMLDALDDRASMQYWLELGGDATVRSYGVEPREQLGDAEAVRRLFVSALPAAHRRFLSRLQRSHRMGDVLFAHAGIRPGVPVDEQDPRDLVWIREGFLDHPGDLGIHVVHGHTPVDAPDSRGSRTNIDTGAVYGGALTAAVLEGETMRFLSVPAG
jgi:serine/threonine protein phosphatase 1